MMQSPLIPRGDLPCLESSLSGMALEESELAVPELEREENLIAAARHIVRALGSKKNLTSDAKRILADLASQLSSMTRASAKVGEEDEERLNSIEEKIMRWEEEGSMMWWETGQDEEASEYVMAAEEARGLVEKLEALHLTREDKEYRLLLRATCVVQTAMVRLEQEFMSLIVHHRKVFEAEYVSFRSIEGEIGDEVNSVASLGNEESSPRDSIGKEEHVLHLVHPHVIPRLRCIANLMLACNYDRECCHAYTASRRDALEECLSILQVERLGIENVMTMEWATLNSKIKRWIWAFKIFVRVYLASEKWLCDQIFGEREPLGMVCFVDASKPSILQLLNFGEAMSIGPHRPEKLFKILDMYEVVGSLIPDVDALYSGHAGACIMLECHEVLKRLGGCVKATFLEFERAIASNYSPAPFVGGGIHPLTRYVMNYVTTLIDYSETLTLLLNDCQEEGQDSIIPVSVSPMAFRLRSVASILECNLDDKAKLYRDASMQHLFLMNNIHYMARKVKGSELRPIFGDDWIRKRKWTYRHHATNYERTSLSSILSLLKDEGIQMPGTISISKNLLKERLRCFYLAFEDLYRIQTGWCIPDAQLREELQISLSLKLIQAYRTFVGRHKNQIGDKHIKYNADDLESYLLDFFEGAAKSLQNPHRR